MSLPVGINKNLVSVTAKKNDKGTLVYGVKQASVDPLAVLNGTGSLDAQSQEFLLFPFKSTNSVGEVRDAKKILDDVNDFKDKLRQILEIYLTSDKVTLAPTKDIASITDGASLMSEITKQSILDRMYNNLVDQFIQQITPFLGDNGIKVNAIFPRQNAAKHFPTLRSRFVKSNPFIERADVPVSKLKWTSWEIKNGLTTGERAGGAAAVSTEEATTAANLFA